MAKKYTRKHQKLVKKKRKWFTVNAPKGYFKGSEIGEILAVESSKLIGRHITTNISNVTGIRNPNISLTFRINEIKDDNAQTEIVGYKLSPAFVKRATRKKRSKIDYTLVLKSKEGVELIVKVFLITRTLVSSKILTDIRNKAKIYLTEYFEKHSYNQIFEKVLGKDLQSDVRSSLKNVYPLSTSEIRVLKRK